MKRARRLSRLRRRRCQLIDELSQRVSTERGASNRRQTRQIHFMLAFGMRVDPIPPPSTHDVCIGVELRVLKRRKRRRPRRARVLRGHIDIRTEHSGPQLFERYAFIRGVLVERDDEIATQDGDDEFVANLSDDSSIR